MLQTRFKALMAVLVVLSPTVLAQTPELAAVATPLRPYIEHRHHQKVINFDLLVTNRSNKTFRLVALHLDTYGRDGSIETSRQLNENGRPPGLNTLGTLRLQPGTTVDYFQPFESFGEDIDLHRVHVELWFMADDRPSTAIPLDADVKLVVDVVPQDPQFQPYCLPILGPLLVQDGHDLYSHHRRRAIRPDSNSNGPPSPNLFAYDFVSVDERGAFVYGDRSVLTNWLTYGQPVRSPSSGSIIVARDGIPDNFLAPDGTVVAAADVDTIDPDGFGNHIVIRHPDGRYSWLLHLKPRSLLVRPGQKVKAGQPLAQVGFGGDSLFPHLHYMVTDSAQYPSRGMPSYFANVIKPWTHPQSAEQITQVDSGDIVRDRGGVCAPGEAAARQHTRVGHNRCLLMAALLRLGSTIYRKLLPLEPSPRSPYGWKDSRRWCHNGRIALNNADD